MFRARADFLGEVEVAAEVGGVREFFCDLRNLVQMMPGVESVTAEEGGMVRWAVRAEVPLVGAMRGAFNVVRTDVSPARVEWGPAPGEQKNLLRYAAGFEALHAGRTRVRAALRVELRRRHAAELHLMAPLIGSTRISAGIEVRLNEMMRTFLERARAELEKVSKEQ